MTDMSYMFNSANNLTTLNVQNWNTSNVVNMAVMFSNTSNLTQLNVSNWNTSKVTNMASMFRGVSKLTTIYVGSGWSTASVTNSTYMFYGAYNIRGGNGTTYSASYVDKTYARIDKSGQKGYFTAAGAKGINGGSSNFVKSSASKASVNVINSYDDLAVCNNICGTTCLESGNSYVCPSYSCSDGKLSGTECYK